MPYPKQIIGTFGEDRAAEFLQKAGYRILARNWKSRRLELDIICSKGEELVFVEVKTRTADTLQSAKEALSPTQQKNLLKAAQDYLTANHAWELPCRFDLICVTCESNNFYVEHITNAFEFNVASGPVGSVHSAWQPW